VLNDHSLFATSFSFEDLLPDNAQSFFKNQ